MGGEHKFMKAKTLIDQHLINLSHAKFDADRPFLSFEITTPENTLVIVQFNHKGWISDWTESDEEYALRCAKARRSGKEVPMRWTSSYLTKTDDFHILACKMWLRRVSLTTLNSLSNCVYRQADIEQVLNAALQASISSKVIL